MSTSPGESTNRADHPPTEHLQGIVERVTYHAEDSGYTVARLKAPGERDLITIVGSFPDIHAGQTLRLTGYWREHLNHRVGEVPGERPHQGHRSGDGQAHRSSLRVGDARHHRA